MNAAATSFQCSLLPPPQPGAVGAIGDGERYDDDDSGSEYDVIDVLSADHCTGEHSYTMQMPPSMLLEEERRRVYESPELQAARRLVDWLDSPACRKYSAPFLDPLEIEQRPAYLRVVRQPMCLSRVRAGLDSRSYAGITEVVRDVRLILENCYRFYGPQHHLTKKALRLETVLEQKLALLPRELREKTTLEATTLENRDLGAQRAGRRARLTSQLPTGGESSALLQLVKAEKAAQAREERLKQREERRVEKEVAQQAVIDWESSTFGPGLAELSHHWEVPQLCQFLRLSQEPLQLPDVTIAEVERSLLMPKKSSLLSLLMTCLLVAPQQRPKTLLQHPMPYRVWNERLRCRLQNWYRTYMGSQRNFLKVFEAHGLEEQFFFIMGETDPMENKDFHELDLVQRVWLLKALCDHKLGQHRRVQEYMAEQEADRLREAFLGEDRVGRRYIYFPCMAEPRVYRVLLPQPPATPEREPSPPPQPTPKVSHKLKKKGRPQRGSSRRSSRHKKAKAAAVKEECEEEEKKAACRYGRGYETRRARHPRRKQWRRTLRPRMGNRHPRRNQHQKSRRRKKRKRKCRPDFETVVTSVADLRILIASLAESNCSSNSNDSKEGATEENRPTTRKGSAEAAKVEEGVERPLLDQLRILLSEWETEEAAFQQTDAALRTRLHHEWHQPDTQDIHGSEDAVDSWTMHYKDECLIEDSSSDESMSQEEYNDNADDHEEGVEMEEECKDSSGWRVLRKRKIALALPNGLSNSDEESAASEPSSQPVAHPPSQPSRVTSCQVSTQTVSPIPTLARSIPAVSKESVAKVSIPHILARNSTSATLTTVTPSSTTWIRPFTRVQLDHPKRSTEYHKRQAEQAKRPTKVRSLLEAGYTTFTEPSRPSTPQSTQAAPVTVLPVVQEQVVMQNICNAEPATMQNICNAEPVVMQKIHTAEPAVMQNISNAEPTVMQNICNADPVVMQNIRNVEPAVMQNISNAEPTVMQNICNVEPVVMQKEKDAKHSRGSGKCAGNSGSGNPEFPSGLKSVLVPAVDNSGQEILLHVEYTTLDEASLGNNLQSLPLPTVPPVGPSYSTTMPAPDFTGALSGMQNMSASSTVIQNLQMAPPVVQNVPVVQSLMQTLPHPPVEIPVATSLMQTLPVSSPVVQPSVTLPALLQNRRREGTNSRKHGLPWWKHSNTPSTTKVKEIPPLAPIAAPRKIFKSRNAASSLKQYELQHGRHGGHGVEWRAHFEERHILIVPAASATHWL
nr:LOW QUALITY PROTEIN: uncharacterized protein LOC119181589 [Rhipicephalus microplus]